MPSYVYILMHHSGQRFKIGKAIDIDARATQLRKDRFKLIGSFGLLFETEARSYEIESALHRLFAEYRLDTQTVTAEDQTEAGSTEFFLIECYDQVVDFIERNLAVLQAVPVYDLAPVFEGERQAVIAARKAATEGKRVALEERQQERARIQVERAASEWKKCLEQIEGPLSTTFKELNGLCTISVRGHHVMFISHISNREYAQKAIDVLDTILFAGAGEAAVRLIGDSRQWPDEDERGEDCYVSVLHFEFMAASDNTIENNLRKLLCEAFNRHRATIVHREVEVQHLRCWKTVDQWEAADLRKLGHSDIADQLETHRATLLPDFSSQHGD